MFGGDSVNKKLQRLIEPGTRLFLLIMVAFAVATFFFNEKLAAIEAIVIALLVITVSVIRITKTFFGMIRKWKMIHHIRIFRGMKYDDVSGVLNKALRSGKKEFELHPATYACLRTYVDRVIYDSIFHVNRRI